LSETPCDELCDLLIQEKAGEAIPEILFAVKEMKKGS
jgi:hypothetical protein